MMSPSAIFMRPPPSMMVGFSSSRLRCGDGLRVLGRGGGDEEDGLNEDHELPKGPEVEEDVAEGGEEVGLMEEALGDGGISRGEGGSGKVIRGGREVDAEGGAADGEVHGGARGGGRPGGNMGGDEVEGGAADIEAEGLEDLEEGPEDGEVGVVREHHHRLLLAAAGEALILALLVDDVAVDKSVCASGGEEEEGEDGVVDGRAVARVVVGHGVGKGGEGDEVLLVEGTRLRGAGREDPPAGQ